MDSKYGVRSVVGSSGLSCPFGKTTVNLAPDNVKKEGASFDLLIAFEMLYIKWQLKKDILLAAITKYGNI